MKRYLLLLIASAAEALVQPVALTGTAQNKPWKQEHYVDEGTGYDKDWQNEHKSGPYPKEAEGKAQHPDISEAKPDADPFPSSEESHYAKPGYRSAEWSKDKK